MTPVDITDPHHARRWWVLVLVAIAQLMVVLDATIVNIALPSAQTALGAPLRSSSPHTTAPAVKLAAAHQNATV